MWEWVLNGSVSPGPTFDLVISRTKCTSTEKMPRRLKCLVMVLPGWEVCSLHRCQHDRRSLPSLCQVFTRHLYEKLLLFLKARVCNVVHPAVNTHSNDWKMKLSLFGYLTQTSRSTWAYKITNIADTRVHCNTRVAHFNHILVVIAHVRKVCVSI